MPGSAVMFRVLYVEDNDLVREITAELLEADDRELVAVASAEEALLAFNSRPADLVITDVSLPNRSGVDLARSLLQMRPGLPVIIASGHSIGDCTQALGPTVRAIIKPFAAADIERLIDELAPATVG